MDLWDPSLPGAGAQRAVLILQLYMRMGHYSPLSILVTDALGLTFKADGATISELSAYLGLTSDRVEIGISGIPREVYCTSAELRQDDGSGEAESGKTNGRKRGRQDDAEVSTLRYYINYATLLPFVFAHGSHMLLALCQMPVPQQLTNDGPSSEHAALNVSPTLRRVYCKRGLCCASCRYWMALKDLRSTISRCPLCQADILTGILRAIKARYEEKLARGQSLLSFGPLQQAATSSTRSTGAAKETQEKTFGDEFFDVLLARDPFLVQQGLFFQFLYAHPFVCVNDAAFVVDVDEVMTKEEYDHRSRHRATVLDQFRLVHRNSKTIRVRRLDQEQLETAKCAASRMKLEKRGQLPPWLQPASLFAEGERQTLPEARKEEPVAVGVEAKVARRNKGQSDIVAIARYIAREYFDDDYDEVPLSKSLTG